ncbi:phosphodiester glycosidase family protein [Ornithinibacillus californiensis]|uniref:phosphodiester glycosidase family protein n=1 Tax=Ornithinibacillus californiensis TaxID=161536 RepID=UPI00064DDFDB|nr:phosphodiester glycosidase family protein [Ornithinibacillus californiensis]
MNRKWISSFLVGVLAVSTISPVVQAEGNPISDVRPASSDKSEPIVTVGPAGKTILANEETTQIGPGIELTTFERFDVRGWLNGEVMSVNMNHEAVSADLLFPGVITSAKPLSEMAKQYGAIAGVNGDFFDINNTKAPSGAMIQDGNLLKSPQGSHILTAGVDENGIGKISNMFLEGRVQLPSGEVELAALNQSSIPTGGIGLYTSLWGQAQRPTSGTTYEVVVQDGRVVSTSSQAGGGVIEEGTFILVGRDAGATHLQALSIGDEVSIIYAPRVDGDTLMKFAIGGNVQLVENGNVRGNLDDSTTAPRTAVGFTEDGQTMILVVVDGRQTDSRGMTLQEMGELMKEYGAYQALNIDGGGSSTMVARMPGYGDAKVVNSPSDGSERSVPNGIGIFVEDGSGELKNFAVETVMKDDKSSRVFPGLSRSFVGLGYDENFSPVGVDGIQWQALPADVGSFDDGGIFYAKKSGKAVAEAQVQSAKGAQEIVILGELDRIEASQSYIGLEMGRTASFTVSGYDQEGYTAPIEARDITLDYDDQVITVEENSDGSFTVVPLLDGGSTTITITVLDKVVQLPITVGLSTVSISGFESTEGWSFTKYPSAVGASMEIVDGRQGNGIQLSYDFSTTTATRAAYLQTSPMIELPGDVQNIGLWVHGDGNGAWLRTVLEDAAGTRYTLTLANSVNWTGWKYVETTLPEGIQYPVKLWRIYPVETNRNDQYTGALIFDDLTVKVPPTVAGVEVDTATPDPLIVPNEGIGEDRWKFAVLSDSQFVALSPNSQQAQMARKALREIVAANPEFLVVNGDLVDTAWEEDFAFAKQVLEEEVGDAFPIYYTPGNHEIVGSGSLNNFLEVFGENRYSFDHKGTRFILLDSSTGSFRTSDFEQLIELKQSLNEAAANPSINNVVVLGHHPTRDPLPTNNSQLSDRKEAVLLEDWLTEFRETSGGKGAIYISGHAHTVHLERVEGVPYMVTGSAGKAPYGSSNNGGFYAWTMFGVDPTPIPAQAFGPENAAAHGNASGSEWIQVEVRPILESISMDAPESMAIGETVVISADGHQAGGLNFPLQYPASTTWIGSKNVFVGTGNQLERAIKTAQYKAVYDIKTGKLTALKSGEIWLKVMSNGVEQVKNIIIE